MLRRNFLWWSGGFTAALTLSPGLALGGSMVEITMTGRSDGSKVWFDPYGVLVRPGQTIRWTNRDKGNAHTATAYAPENDDHPLRIPNGAAAFDSDYLLPDESYEVALEKPGVYDYFCIPHEMSGMVGRIIVAEPDQTVFDDYPGGGLPDAVLDGLPEIVDILKQGRIQHGE
ncbi:plastocyanin/azurin family copper-binding protein [Roseovarius sp. Pro17]|uniref:plastocyanin/azurin family copper-binding protein n=1 Tax=Roseovarius sp. Pro17 TaxID=3108175 RepID=UPI002D771EBA|nr:plastocyanin/azurin family copper-binding protein [Roseovarius sp. Pro17]